MVEITGVLPHSRAARAGILTGDILLEINSHKINDVLDYRFRLADEVVMLKLHRGPDIIEVKIKKALSGKKKKFVGVLESFDDSSVTVAGDVFERSNIDVIRPYIGF